MPTAVKDADNAILRDEMEWLMATPPHPWDIPEHGLGVQISCMLPETAKLQFLIMAQNLGIE